MEALATLVQRTRRRRFLWWTGGLTAIIALGKSPRRVQAADDGATLLSVGIATIPSDPFAWRLVRDTVPGFGTGESLERALGFRLLARGATASDL